MSRKIKTYIAGSLFSNKEIDARVNEEKQLKEKFGDKLDIYNPITNDEINDKTKKPTARDIFLQDTKKVIESEIITCDLDDRDEGQAMELGIAYGINYMLKEIFERIEKAKAEGNKNKEKILTKLSTEMFKKCPRKIIFGSYSDIRQDTKNEEGIYKSVGVNQYLVGGVEEMGTISRDFKATLEEIKDTIERYY